MANPAIQTEQVEVSYFQLQHISLHQMIRHPNLRKREQLPALKGVSFVVQEGEILGIVGENGSGKSTLLKTIAGIIQPDRGRVDTFGKRVSLMSLGVGFKQEATGRQNIMISGMLLRYPVEYIRAKMDEIIAFSELGHYIDRPVRSYSSGMYAKLSFAISAVLEMDIMLVDEVLSVGDERFQQKSFARMEELIRSEKRTGIIVSHDLDVLEPLCDRVLWLHDGQVRMTGETAQVLAAYRAFMDYQGEENHA